MSSKPKVQRLKADIMVMRATLNALRKCGRKNNGSRGAASAYPDSTGSQEDS